MSTIPQITSEQAWQMLVNDDRAVLVDVRTESEWRTVGVPDLEQLGRQARHVHWTDERGTPNPYFIDTATDGLEADTPILLLCRSGARSQAAAELLAAAGYTGAHNIIAGFEGPRGPDGTHAGGWKDKLPATTYG
jgi:rhodanese-related sulfurtransferase